VARRQGFRLPELKAAVRTGDTTARERQALLRNPPHVLITTPESLHLILTSQARDTLRTVQWCIVDEIHALCANKRGVFLSLLLERLEELTPASFIRIGLSATQRPLEEVARYLGGRSGAGPDGEWSPRPVNIVDAGLRKQLDLQVLTPVEQFGPLPERSIWPSIYRTLYDQIRSHRSTIVFANNRRTVERITTQLNELAEVAESNESPVDDDQADLTESSLQPSRNRCLQADVNGQLARAHHGSIALEVRQQTEQALKEGRLPAVVATASLELGIDMGAVDLVCQVESPGSVSRALQRVGRAGHLVGQGSKGRLVAKTLPDLLEQAVLAREMAAGRVEAMRVPTNCLDVLAQQIVAMVAMESWKVPDLYAVIRRAYPFRELSPALFESVLEMVSGRFPSDSFRDLRPRISWDRVHNQLHPLPGSRQLAVVNGGTIPDTGQFAAYIAGQSTRIGELDEEFVYERRIGDTFVLGTTAWRIEDIGDDRVQVSRVEGMPAMMPFWRGEDVGRTPDLGLAIGAFLRELVERLPSPDVLDWLQRECHLHNFAARNLLRYVRRQVEQAACVPTDRTLLVEAFRDQVGDWHVAVLSPFGSRFNLTLRLAIEGLCRRRYGYAPQCLHHDDGLLMRVADMDEPPLDLLESLAAEDVEPLVLAEIDDSALFAVRFRQNAARALLMPRARPDRRAPLWLQRLKGRTLLQLARQHPSFPIVIETYRECLHDHLDVDRLRSLLREIAAGSVEVVRRRGETPSPFASSLLFGFTAAFMYENDRVEADSGSASEIDKDLLEQLLKPESCEHLLDPRAIHQVERRLRGVGLPPRTPDELAEWLRQLGDLSSSELEQFGSGFIGELQSQGRVQQVTLHGVAEPQRWILTEEAPLYHAAFHDLDQESRGRILRRFLQTHALVGLDDVLQRYPFDKEWAEAQIENWVEQGMLVSITGSSEENSRFSLPSNLQQVQRASLALQRREILSCSAHQFADFLLRWQYRHPTAQQAGPEGLRSILHRLEGLALPAELWEQAVLPTRLKEYQARWLDELIQGGEWVWIACSNEDRGPGEVAFFNRASLSARAGPLQGSELPAEVQAVYEDLRQHGASFLLETAQRTGLTPARVRRSVWQLVRGGLVTNDRYDVVRRGESVEDVNERGVGSQARPSRRRRLATMYPEGRWSLIQQGTADLHAQAIHHANLLLERYGVVTREIAALQGGQVPWRVTYEVLSRMEWAGDVRRGWFVEGLSGAQFALPEAAAQLGRQAPQGDGSEPTILIHSLDPANLFGPGAPLPSPIARRPGNWLVIRSGRPVLGVEAHGKRLLSMPQANQMELKSAVAQLRDLLRTGHGIHLRGKVMVEEWDGRPIMASEGKELLEAAGFVRDYQGMTLYAGW